MRENDLAFYNNLTPLPWLQVDPFKIEGYLFGSLFEFNCFKHSFQRKLVSFITNNYRYYIIRKTNFTIIKLYTLQSKNRGRALNNTRFNNETFIHHPAQPSNSLTNANKKLLASGCFGKSHTMTIKAGSRHSITIQYIDCGLLGNLVLNGHFQSSKPGRHNFSSSRRGR